MATGEGKTLTATLPACDRGAGRHAGARDHRQRLPGRARRGWMGPLYALLRPDGGRRRRTACDPTQRRAAYAVRHHLLHQQGAGVRLPARPHWRSATAQPRCTCGSSGLRDGAPRAPSRLLLRGLHFGIVDEADSVFIDEARTPLIISGRRRRPRHEQRICARGAGDRARRWSSRARLRRRAARARGAPHRRAASAATAELAEPLRRRLALGAARGEELVAPGARARCTSSTRDQHYLVRDGKVQIVDESTGRVMADRSWERGLHQMIEAKEGVRDHRRSARRSRASPTSASSAATCALAGMTGTATRGGARAAGGLPAAGGAHPDQPAVARGGAWPTACLRRPPPRSGQAVADAAQRAARATGRPVLIGTRSVAASEQLERAARGAPASPHVVLNARQDERGGARSWPRAGEPRPRSRWRPTWPGAAPTSGSGAGVAERGGLHVILTEFHESRRIDRQLFGRCARQGDPGQLRGDRRARRRAVPRARAWGCGWPAVLVARVPLLAGWIVRRLTGLAQSAAERRNAFVRMQTLKSDLQIEKTPGVFGQGGVKCRSRARRRR